MVTDYDFELLILISRKSSVSFHCFRFASCQFLRNPVSDVNSSGSILKGMFSYPPGPQIPLAWSSDPGCHKTDLKVLEGSAGSELPIVLHETSLP